ncbi:MAG: hypothetical protein GVY19_09735 [Bacteroidetes bacterium]|jgi:hypothetical protein|nr:hypothetical protein [Bacteroidota bacterium]
MRKINKIKWLAKVMLLSALTVCFMVSCEQDDDDNGNPENKDKTSGFVISGTKGESGSVKYFEEIPTGTVDLSDGQDFITYLPRDVYNHNIYTPRIDGTFGMSQLAVDQDGKLYEKGYIPTTDWISRFTIKDENTGVFHGNAELNEFVIFDATTMEITGSIDISGAVEPNAPEESRYQDLVLRGDDVFGIARPTNSGTGYSGFFLHHANIASKSYVGKLSRSAPLSGGITPNYEFGQQYADDNGDIYILDGGSIGTGIYARVHKITSGNNTLDTTYDFQPGAILAPSNILFPHARGFRVIGNGLAIAKVNKDVPQEAVDIVNDMPGETYQEKLQALQANDEKLNQVLGLLFAAETAVWCELDLTAKKVTEITGAPATGSYSVSTTFEHKGDIYFSVASSTEVAYYKYTPGTPSASKAFDVTGAELLNCINIANNN